MSFLALIAEKIIEWLLMKGYAEVHELIERLQKRAQIAKQSDASVQPLKDAKTGDEIDKAADSTLNGA